MPDYGNRVANHAITTIDRKLRRTYKTAQQELERKLAAFTKRFEAKDAAKRKQLAEGKITLQAYQNWLAGQVFMKGQWQSKIKEVTQVLLHHNEVAADIVHQHKLDVFAENYNYEAFKTESKFGQVATGMGISFDVYNAQAVERLIQQNPQILPRWKVDEEKDYAWNYKKVSNLVRQGIIQGESIDQIAKRLCSGLCTQSENKMRMFARTAITGAQNAGRQQQMNDAADMGIEIHKQWLATLDTRTRDAHRQLDGQEVAYNKPFKSDLGNINYPGDPSADPANVYNCRCTIVSIYPKYEDRSKPSWRESEIIDGQNYDEWKEHKLKTNLAYIKANADGTVSSDIPGAASSAGNWAKLADKIEYGELFPEEAVKITKDTLDKLYEEYPISEPMGVVGDIRVIRNLDREAEGIDLVHTYQYGARYLPRGNSVIHGGRAGIEVVDETYNTHSLLAEFRELYELRKRYGFMDESTAFYTTSFTLEGIIMHEYAHAIQDEYGLFGGSRSSQAVRFSEWLTKYWEDNKENVRQISNYAAKQPFEMMAEAFVQIHDIEHTETTAYKTAREIWDEFEKYRLGKEPYVK